MAALVCEICGGKLVGKAGGIFVCDSCGMEYDKTWAQEKIQEIKGTVKVEGTVNVRVDNTDYHKNYLDMAISAYESGNNAECEQYCNKIIEQNPQNYEAYLYKGKSAGWQSTLDNNRIFESVAAFSKALEFVPEEERDELEMDIKDDIIDLSTASMKMVSNRFVQWPDKDEAERIKTHLLELINVLKSFIVKCSEIEITEFLLPIGNVIVASCNEAISEKITPEFKNDNEGYPSDYALELYISRMDATVYVIQAVADFVFSVLDENNALLISLYKSIINIQETLMSACSYSYETVHVRDSWWDGSAIYDNKYVKSKELTEQAKGQRRKIISSYKDKIATIESAIADKKREEHQKELEEKRKLEQERQKLEQERRKEEAIKQKQREDAKKARVAAYWAEHSEEKQNIQSQINEQRQKIDALLAQKKELNNNGSIVTFEEAIKKLQDEMDSLGAFKAKKKQELSQQIEKLQTEKANEESRILGEIDELDAEISARRKRVSALMEELEKDR